MLHEAVEAALKGCPVIGLSPEYQGLVQACLLVAATYAYVGLVAKMDNRPTMERIIECQLDVTENIGGIVDLVYYEENGHCVIIDWKFGAGVEVEAENNHQLLVAAVAARKKWGCKTFELVIFQPRLSSTPSVWNPSLFLVEAFGEALLNKEREILGGCNTLACGEWCKFCPAKPTCPAQLKRAQEIAKLEFAPKGLPAPTTMSPAVIAEVLDHRSQLEDWLKSVADHAKDLIKLGSEIPGYKLVNGKSNRTWTFADETTAHDLHDVFGIEPYTKKIISPAQAEKLIPKDLHNQLAGLWEKSPGAPTLTKVSDKRKEIANNKALVVSEFSNTADEENIPWA